MPAYSSPSVIRTAIDTWVVPILSRARTKKALFLLVALTSGLLLLHTTAPTLAPKASRWAFGSDFASETLPVSQCSPREYAEGKWVYRPYYTRAGPLTRTTAGWDAERETAEKMGLGAKNMTKPEDVLKFARFEGCASSCEYWLHLAADREEQWDRFPRAMEWEWVPGGRCSGSSTDEGAEGLRDWRSEEVVRDMVEGGGWLLVGDSVTENHFFSLSCLLYPHVIAAPDYTKLHSWDRGMPQHLYLNPSSPLLQHDDSILVNKNRAGQNSRQRLKLPPGFDVATTPLVTFRRIDLLWSPKDLEIMHKELHPEFYDKEFKLFGDEAVWSISPDEYLDVFTTPLPGAHYTTMIVSTGGHWTTNLFAGYQNGGQPSGGGDNSDTGLGRAPVYGYEGLIQFFEEVMERWGKTMQERIDAEAAATSSTYPPSRGATVHRGNARQVVVRAYLPGHEECRQHRFPWDEIVPFQSTWWNWGFIERYNQIFEKLLSSTAKPLKNVHYLPIDRPARLRPDAHSSWDCLHIMTGAGVLEGWSHYIWHFITREI